MPIGRDKLYKKPDLIVFDLDGTLTDVSDRAARLSSVSDRLNVPFSQAAYWTLKTAYKIYKDMGLKSNAAEVIKDEVMNTLCAEKLDMFYVLSAAYDAYIPCAIMSNGPRQWGEKILRRQQIHHFFNNTVFREDMACLKPDPGSLFPLLEASGIGNGGNNKTVWICGDRSSDVGLALNANKFLTHDIIPVAFQGTKAAGTIEALREKNYAEGIVFDNPHAMACAIDPDIEKRIEMARNKLEVIQEHVIHWTIQ